MTVLCVMKIYLRKISNDDGIRELEYLRSLPENESGFCNPTTEENLLNEENFRLWLNEKVSDLIQ